MENQTQFKALAHMGVFIDSNLLGKGIYQVAVPHIYNNDEAIESLIAKYERIAASGFGLGDFIENLKQCELVDVTITINNHDTQTTI